MVFDGCRASLSYFEAMLGASVALLLGIPVLLDQIMRPRYEERFEGFKQESNDKFLETLDKALQKIKHAEEKVNPETVEIMETLFANWERVKANENQLQSLISTRKYLFLGWMTSVLLSVFATSYSNVVLLREFNLGQLSTAVFGLMAALSTFYAMALFSLDDKLAKFKKNPTKQNIVQKASVSRVSSSFSVSKGLMMEQEVENILRRFLIPYETGRYPAKGLHFDFAIPSAENPSYIIEVKTRLMFSSILGDLSQRLNDLKRTNPQVKGIIVTNVGESSPKALKTVKEEWLILDFLKIEELGQIIKL
jgi:hypothetical protein